MKKTLGKRLADALDEAITISRGERAPSRVWNVTKRSDGTWSRRQVDPEAVRLRNKAA